MPGRQRSPSSRPPAAGSGRTSRSSPPSPSGSTCCSRSSDWASTEPPSSVPGSLSFVPPVSTCPASASKGCTSTASRSSRSRSARCASVGAVRRRRTCWSSSGRSRLASKHLDAPGASTDPAAREEHRARLTEQLGKIEGELPAALEADATLDRLIRNSQADPSSLDPRRSQEDSRAAIGSRRPRHRRRSDRDHRDRRHRHECEHRAPERRPVGPLPRRLAADRRRPRRTLLPLRSTRNAAPTACRRWSTRPRTGRRRAQATDDLPARDVEGRRRTSGRRSARRRPRRGHRPPPRAGLPARRPRPPRCHGEGAAGRRRNQDRRTHQTARREHPSDRTPTWGSPPGRP